MTSAVLERAAREWSATRDRVDPVIAELRQLRAVVVELQQAQTLQGAEAVPVEVAGALLGCRRTQVFALLAIGKLTPAPRQGRRRMVTRASVDALLKVNAEATKAPRQRKPAAEAEAAGWGDEIRRLAKSLRADRPGAREARAAGPAQ